MLPVPACFALAAAAVLCCALTAESAEWTIQPGVTFGEEYTDNVYLVPTDQREDFISRFAPSLQMTYKAPRWEGDASYSYDYRYHANTPLRDEKDQAGRLNALGRIVPEFLYLGIKDEYARVSLDPVRDYTQESTFVNQTDRNVFEANPYFATRITEQTAFTTGYRYRSTVYRGSDGVDTAEHTGYADVRQEMSARTAMTCTASYMRNYNHLLLFTHSIASLGPDYEYADGSRVSASAGYSRLAFAGYDRIYRVFWDVRISGKYAGLIASLESGMSYIADPTQLLRREDRYLASLREEGGRTTLAAEGGIREYRNAITDRREVVSHRLGGTLTHAVTASAKIVASVIAERLADEVSRVSTTRWLPSLRFERTVRDGFTWAAEYRYADVYAPGAPLTDYRSNRYLVEVRKSF